MERRRSTRRDRPAPAAANTAAGGGGRVTRAAKRPCAEQPAAAAAAAEEAAGRRSRRARAPPARLAVSAGPASAWRDEPAAAAQAPEERLVGRAVSKNFPPHGTFRGTVTASRHSASEREDVYTVAYEDGDKEELTLAELRSALVPAGPKEEEEEEEEEEETAADAEEEAEPEEEEEEEEDSQELDMGGCSQLVSYSQATCSQDNNALFSYDPPADIEPIAEEGEREETGFDTSDDDNDDETEGAASTASAAMPPPPPLAQTGDGSQGEGVAELSPASSAAIASMLAPAAATEAAAAAAAEDGVLPTPAANGWRMSPQGLLTGGQLPSGVNTCRQFDEDYCKQPAPVPPAAARHLLRTSSRRGTAL